MIRSAETFRATAEAIFGSAWQAPLGLALGVNERTIRRWASDDADVPEGVWDSLVILSREKAAHLERLASNIASPGFQTQVGVAMRAPRPRG